MNEHSEVSITQGKQARVILNRLKGRLIKTVSPKRGSYIENEPNRQTSFEVFDEHSPENPYAENPGLPINFGHRPKDWFNEGGISPAGSEGFNHNFEAQRHIGHMLAKVFQLTHSSRVLEFGCGGNFAVAQGVLDTGCHDITLLDYNHPKLADLGSSTTITTPLDVGHYVLDHVPFYLGEFSHALDKDSVFQSKAGTFDLIMINAALVSGGFNYTVAHLGEALYHQQPKVDHDDRQAVSKYVDRYIAGVITTARSLLSVGGTFFFSSSRYADHGAGYFELQLHKEKLQMLKIIEELKRQGAKRIIIFGVTAQGIQQSIEFNLGSEEGGLLRQQLVFKKLFVESFEPPFTLETRDGATSRRVTRDELQRIAEDLTQFMQIMDLPQVKAVVYEKLQEMESRLQEVVDALTAPVSVFPDDLGWSQNEQDTIRRIRTNLSDFPTEIARIDAVGAQF